MENCQYIRSFINVSWILSLGYIFPCSAAYYFRPADRWNRKSQIIPKLGRILKFKPQQCYKLVKTILQTENEGRIGFELWPRLPILLDFSVHSLFKYQNYFIGQLSYFGNNLPRGSKQAETYFMNCILIRSSSVLDQTHTLTQTREVRRDAETPKGDREQFAASLDLWITNKCLTRGVHLVWNMIWFSLICSPY